MTRRSLLGLAPLGLCVLPKIALAIFASGSVVLDPSNLVENTLTAARSLLSNENEARVILQNIEQYAQDAKHLITLPTDMVNQIRDYMRQYQDILAKGKGMKDEMAWNIQQFEDLFRSGWQGDSSLMQQAEGLMGRVREAGRMATRAGDLYDRLGTQQESVNRLLVASQGAPGMKATQQATNQLLGTLANQQGNLQLLLAAQNEMQTSWIMSQVVSSERAEADAYAQRIDATKYYAAVRGNLAIGPRLPQ